jgi:AAA domain
MLALVFSKEPPEKVMAKFLTYICALPFPKRQGRIPQLITDDPAAIEQFARRWDKPGYGVYECVSLLREGSRHRSLENVGCLWFLHFDIDLRAIKEPYNEVLRRLSQLPLRLELRQSGGGFHLIAYLKEQAPVGTVEFERADAIRKKLTHTLCADPAPNHAAALLRKLGTHNFKYQGEPVCEVIQPGEPVDITELEDLLELLGDEPIFTPVTRATNGHDHTKGVPFPGEDRKVPVDIEARLAAMTFHGAGDSGINITQLHCTASLLRSGIPVKDVVADILQATRNATASDLRAAKWDWNDERLAIERLCYNFISKNPELSPLLPHDLAAAWNDRLAEGRTKLRIVHSSHIGWHVRSEKTEDHAYGTSDNPTAEAATQKIRGWNYYDTTEVTPQRWCVKKLLPETGVGILSGQWGSFKTTAALDLSVAVMTGQPFAGQYRIKRPGAVLYFATEGAGTLQSRLAAIARHRGAPDKLPFAWRSDSPVLTDRNAGQAIMKYVNEAAVHFEHTYGVSIVLIWVDTYITAAGLSSGDDNDVAATQKAFNTLRFVAANSGAFVCTVDHYGKIVEAGTRGSSGKEGNADTVLATLAEREITGTISNTRMAARKQRDGMSGFETPFTPETVEQGLDEDGDPITAIVLDWGAQRQG